MYSDDPPDKPEHDVDRRRLVERLLPELIKRAIETGVEKLSEGPENLRNFVGELRLPKDAANYLLGQIDETKNGLYRVVAREIRDFLQNTNMTDEVMRALTKLSFEIRTEIRFVPNSSDEPLFPKPEVKTDVHVKTHGQDVKEERTKRRSR